MDHDPVLGVTMRSLLFSAVVVCTFPKHLHCITDCTNYQTSTIIRLLKPHGIYETLHCIQKQVPKTHQSSGLTASGSGIFGLSSQSSGFRSSGSSISREGFTGGVMSFNDLTVHTDYPLIFQNYYLDSRLKKTKCNFFVS